MSEPVFSECPPPGLGPLAVFRLGLKVLASELKWLVMRGFRRYEICSFKRQLDREHRRLGSLSELDAASSQQDVEVSKRQVQFLKDEIAHLERELHEKRIQYVANRVRRWHLDAGV